MGKDLRWGLANQMLITCPRSLIYSLHKWNSLLDKNTENVGLGTVFLMMMSIKIFSYWKRLVIKKKKKTVEQLLQNLSDRVYKEKYNQLGKQMGCHGWSWVYESHTKVTKVTKISRDQINQVLGRDEVIYWEPWTIHSNNLYTDHLRVFNMVTEAVNTGTGNWFKHSMNFRLYTRHKSRIWRIALLHRFFLGFTKAAVRDF